MHVNTGVQSKLSQNIRVILVNMLNAKTFHRELQLNYLETQKYATYKTNLKTFNDLKNHVI